MIKDYSKRDIDRLGNTIREEYGKISDTTKLSNPTLEFLQSYRTSHKEPLSIIFNKLCSYSKYVDKTPIVTYRIKRFESIIGKLVRLNDMKFSRMWDIGGCRCILKNNEQVYKLAKMIENKFTIRKTNDYINTPREEGYKSLHLYVSNDDSDKIIEVQLRNIVDHNWSTLVEITDLLFDSKLKELKPDTDLLRFHQLLSYTDNIGLAEKMEIAKILKKYDYFNSLSKVFSRNYIQVRKDWNNIERNRKDQYFLIEANKDDIPQITSFASFVEAEENYFSLYKANQNVNIVLTHLPKPTYKQISIAYSNYILSYHAFLDECFDILEDLIFDSLSNKKFIILSKIYYLYNSLTFLHLKNLVTEIKALGNPNIKNENKIKNNNLEWTNDILKQIRNRRERAKKFNTKFSKNHPRNIFGVIMVRTILNIINRIYVFKVNMLKVDDE